MIENFKIPIPEIKTMQDPHFKTNPFTPNEEFYITESSKITKKINVDALCLNTVVFRNRIGYLQLFVQY